MGYVADGPMESIQVQMTNASTPLTMDGDHMRFWVNEDTAEASLSLKISDITSIERLSPLIPGSTGPEGTSEVRLVKFVLPLQRFFRRTPPLIQTLPWTQRAGLL